VRERNHLEDSGIYGRIGLKWIIRKWDGGHDFICALLMLSNSLKMIKIDWFYCMNCLLIHRHE
jgi:hypothetical protein